MAGPNTTLTLDGAIKIGGIIFALVVQGVAIYSALDDKAEKLKDRMVAIEKAQISMDGKMDQLLESYRQTVALREKLERVEQQTKENQWVLDQMKKSPLAKFRWPGSP